MSHIPIVLLVAAFVFRKPLGRIIARKFPDRAKRQRVLATIIAAFLLVIGLRLLALFWGEDSHARTSADPSWIDVDALRRKPRAGERASARAAGEAESGGGQHVVTIGGERIDLALPEGLCPVDPARGGNHAALWQRFTPPPQRQARLLALAIDCPTLRTVETGGLRRPRSLAHLVDSPPDPRLPASLAGALEALERRFSRPELAAKAPVLGRDGLAVYVEQRGGGGEGTARMSGVSAFTARRGQPFIANVFHFGEPPPLAGIRDQARRMVRSLHDLAPLSVAKAPSAKVA